MDKGTSFFIRLRRSLAPILRRMLESSTILRRIGMKLMSWHLKPVFQWDGHTVHMNPSDFGVSFELQSTGEYEGASMDYVRRTLQPGMVFVDVGANIGLFTLTAARQIGANGRVFAFEPGNDNCALLRKNVEVNNYTGNVTVIEKAVSNKSGTCTLFKSEFNPADHRIYEVSKDRKSMEIECIALDDYFKPGNRIDMIKMDIEGAEELAIKGMERILTETKKLQLVVECWPSMLAKAGTDPVALFTSLQNKGFSLSVIDDAAKTITPMDAAKAVQFSWDNDVANILCVRG
jgi:FkbM family methyltransferase